MQRKYLSLRDSAHRTLTELPRFVYRLLSTLLQIYLRNWIFIVKENQILIIVQADGQFIVNGGTEMWVQFTVEFYANA